MNQIEIIKETCFNHEYHDLGEQKNNMLSFFNDNNKYRLNIYPSTWTVTVQSTLDHSVNKTFRNIDNLELLKKILSDNQ